MRATLVVRRGFAALLVGALLVLGCPTAITAQVVGEAEQEQESEWEVSDTLSVTVELLGGDECAPPLFGVPVVPAPDDPEAGLEIDPAPEVDPAVDPALFECP